MATIRFSSLCNGADIECETVTDHGLEVRQIKLIDADGSLAIYGLYSYICPECGEREEREAEENVISLLAASGVPLVENELDIAQIFEANE